MSCRSFIKFYFTKIRNKNVNMLFSVQVNEKSSSIVKKQAQVSIKHQPSVLSVPIEPETETENVYYAFLSKKSDLKICQIWDYIKFKKREDCVMFYQEYSVRYSNMFTDISCNVHFFMNAFNQA